MQKLTAIKARALIHDLSGLRTIREELFRQALEIALPVLEQPEGDGDVFIVMRNPGKVPDIKRPVGDVADYLLQLYRHNPDAVCDVVTYRFAGVSGQWVQDGRELLAMAGVALEQQEKGDDGWIEWGGGEQPVDDHELVEVRFRNGSVEKVEIAGCYEWNHGYYDLSTTSVDIIAYRVIENDGREG